MRPSVTRNDCGEMEQCIDGDKMPKIEFLSVEFFPLLIFQLILHEKKKTNNGIKMISAKKLYIFALYSVIFGFWGRY